MSSLQVATLIATALLVADANAFGMDADSHHLPPSAEVSACADDRKPLTPATELDRLQKTWIDWKEKATSIEVEGFEFFSVLDEDDSTVSRESVRNLVEEVLPKLVAENPDFDLEALSATTAKLFPSPHEKLKSFGRWAEISLVRAADCTRFTMTVDNTPMTTVRRGPVELHYSPVNRQVDVSTKHSGRHAPGIDTFVYGPEKEVDHIRWQSVVTGEATRELIRHGEQGNAAQLEYDAASGAVRYFGVRLSETQYYREHFQSAEVLTRNGVPVPRIVTDITYEFRPPKSRRIKIYVIKSVEVGNEIGRDRFNLRVPQGTNVLFYEGAPGSQSRGIRPAMTVTKKDLNDAEEFARSDEFKRAQNR